MSTQPGCCPSSCLIPGFDGALFTAGWRDALWARFSTAAPNDGGDPSSDTAQSSEPEGSGEALRCRSENGRAVEAAAVGGGCPDRPQGGAFPVLSIEDEAVAVRQKIHSANLSGFPKPPQWPVVGRRAAGLAMRERQGGPPAAPAGGAWAARAQQARGADDRPPRPQPVQQRTGGPGGAVPALPYPEKKAEHLRRRQLTYLACRALGDQFTGPYPT